MTNGRWPHTPLAPPHHVHEGRRCQICSKKDILKSELHRNEPLFIIDGRVTQGASTRPSSLPVDSSGWLHWQMVRKPFGMQGRPTEGSSLPNQKCWAAWTECSPSFQRGQTGTHMREGDRPSTLYISLLNRPQQRQLHPAPSESSDRNV